MILELLKQNAPPLSAVLSLKITVEFPSNVISDGRLLNIAPLLFLAVLLIKVDVELSLNVILHMLYKLIAPPFWLALLLLKVILELPLIVILLLLHTSAPAEYCAILSFNVYLL